MKKFDVEFTYTSEGVVTVEANTAEEASAKVEKILAGGLPHVDVYYTDGKGSVEFVNEIKEGE